MTFGRRDTPTFWRIFGLWGPIALVALLLCGRMLFSRGEAVLAPPYPTSIHIIDGGWSFGANEAGRVVYAQLWADAQDGMRVDVTGLRSPAGRAHVPRLELRIGMPEAELRRVLGPPGWEYGDERSTVAMWGTPSRGLGVDFFSGKVSGVYCIGLPFVAQGGLRSGNDTQSVVAAFSSEYEVKVQPSGQGVVYLPFGTWFDSLRWLASAWDIAVIGLAFGWLWSLLRLAVRASPRRAAVLIAAAAVVPAAYWLLVVGAVRYGDVASTIYTGFWRTFAASLAAMAIWDWARGHRWDLGMEWSLRARGAAEAAGAAVLGALAVTWLGRPLWAFWPEWRWLGREFLVIAVSCAALALVALVTSQSLVAGAGRCARRS
jgi:hypothetical protein